jgi:hypothetical protein
MRRSVLSLLAQPGTCIINQSEGRCYLVVHASAYGFLAWRSPVQHDRTLSFAPSVQQGICFFHMSDVSVWRSADVRCIYDTSAQPASCKLKFAGQAMDVAKFACSRGFKGMNVAQMKQVFNELHNPWKGAKPASEDRLLLAFAQHFFGAEATPEKMEKIVAARHEVDCEVAELLARTELFEKDLAAIWEKDEGEEDIEDIEQQFNELRREREKKLSEREANLKAMRDALAGFAPHSHGGGSAGSGSAEGSGPGRKFIPVPEAGPTLEVARAYVPPGFSLSKDTIRENRWRLRGKLLEGERSRSYGPRSDSEWGALVVLLQMAWRLHERKTGEACPFEFGSEPA